MVKYLNSQPEINYMVPIRFLSKETLCSKFRRFQVGREDGKDTRHNGWINLLTTKAQRSTLSELRAIVKLLVTHVGVLLVEQWE